MKAEVTREQLDTMLNWAIEEYNPDKKIMTAIKEKLKEKNFTIGEINKIINQHIAVEGMDLITVCIVLSAFYEVANENKLNPEKYFTEVEIDEAKNYKKIVEEENKDDIIEISEVKQVNDDFWVATMSYQGLAELYKKGQVIYDRETQRNSAIKEFRNKVIETISINRKAVNEIKDLMVKGLFIPNAITFNVLKTGKEEFNYNQRSEKLIIKNGVSIIDGFHRSLAIIQAVAENPNIDRKTIVYFTNFTAEKAKRFIVQEDKRNPIDKRHIKSIDVEKLENVVVKELNENMNSELKGKITTDRLLINRNLAWVLNDILADAIAYNFELKSRRDANNVSEWLIEGFNEIVGIYYEEFNDNLQETKDKTVLANPSIFVGYIAILKELQNNENWKQKLEDILKGIDFSKDNEIWNKDNLDMFSNTTGRVKIKNVSKYFGERCK